MPKKPYIIITIISLLLIIITFSIIYIKDKKIDKFYLDDTYYNQGKFIKINHKTFNDLDKSTYILYTYNNYCNFSVPCENIFKEFMQKYKIDFIDIPYAEYKQTKLHSKIKYAPSIIIVKKGRVIAYLDANKDEDIDKYQDESKFELWLDKYIYFTK